LTSKTRSDRGFAKIRRGLREHLGVMSDSAVKLYLWLHLVANWQGKERGTVKTSYAAIGEELKWSLSTVKRAVASLQPRYVKTVQVGNQFRPTVIRILKYDKRHQLAGIKTDTSSRASVKNGPYADTSSDTSTLREANETLTNRAPKKGVEGSRSKAAAAALPKPEDSVWNYLSIEPCGPLQFRFLLESRWASRNGHRPSILIGETIDAWETAEGEKPRLAAPLFRALTELRQRERHEPRNPRSTEVPIRTLTAEEIPA